MATEGTFMYNDLKASILSNTIQGKFANSFMSMVTESITTQADMNVYLPVNSFLADEIPEYRELLLNLYNSTFGLYDQVSSIPDELKVAQAALLDSIHFGYDVQTEGYDLYTMNPGLLDKDMMVLPDKVLKSIITENTKGLLKCMRVDVEFVDKDNGIYSYKLVNHRKKIDDENDGVLLVPYLVLESLSMVMYKILQSGAAIKTRQVSNETEKVRVVCTNTQMLEKFCDTPAMVQALDVTLLPLKARVYAPVLGAPSTTAMVTNINLFSLCELKRMKDLASIKALGVQKPKDPIATMVAETSIICTLMELNINDIEEYYRVVEKLPRFQEIIHKTNIEEVTPKDIANYLHTIKTAEINQVLRLVPRAKERILKRRELFNGCKEFIGTASNLKLQLKDNIFRILIEKKDGMLSSITCTNSEAILSVLYGSNYFRNYESVGARANKLASTLKSGGNLEYALEVSGFSSLDKDVFSSLVDGQVKEGTEHDEAVSNAVYEMLGKKKRKSAETNNIMVRTVDSYLTGDGAVDYYRYIDPDKIVRAYILS